MSEQFSSLSDAHRQFIQAQHLFFVGTAAADGRVNVSPKGQDSLRVISPSRILWLNLTGSGNETAAHLGEVNRMTLMWCAFDGPPLILRVYGSARTVHPRAPEWEGYTRLIPAPVGARQYFLMDVDLVQTSCGYAVPLMDYQEDRQVLTKWAQTRGADGISRYWQEKNLVSLDGLDTHIID